MYLCFDMDDTVIDAHKKPMPGVQQALQELLDAGHRISICSARGYVAKELGIPLESVTKRMEKTLKEAGIPYSDIYFGLKPDADFFVDNRGVQKTNAISWREIKNRIIPAKGLVFVMLIGLPGAGKSTFGRERFSNYSRLSRDVLAGMTISKTVARRMELEGMRAAFENGKCVVLDKPNLTPENRIDYIKLAKEYSATVVAYHLDISPELAWKQNMEREEHKQVKLDRFQDMVNMFKEPSLDEGFDFMITLTPENRDLLKKFYPQIKEIEEKRSILKALEVDKLVMES